MRAPNTILNSVLLLPFLLLAGCLVAAGAAQADGYLDGSPAHTTTGDLEDHMSGTEDPNKMMGQTEDPNDLEGQTEDPNDLEVATEDPNDLEGKTEELADHEGKTYNLTDLREEAPDDGFDPIAMKGQDEWKPSLDPQIVVARRHLEQAQKRARAARERYGIMMQNDYPRGAAREAIVRERDDSMVALEAAKDALRGVDSSLAPASPY